MDQTRIKQNFYGCCEKLEKGKRKGQRKVKKKIRKRKIGDMKLDAYCEKEERERVGQGKRRREKGMEEREIKEDVVQLILSGLLCARSSKVKTMKVLTFPSLVHTC